LSDRQWLNCSLRACLLAALLFCIYLAARQGIAASRFRQGSPQAIQAAIRWDSGNPQYYDGLALLSHHFSANSNPEEIVGLCETATRLSPYNAQYWADLGAAQEWAGHTSEAGRAFDRALELFPNSPEINWQAANFDIRSRKTLDGLRALQKVLLSNGIGGIARRDVFALATRAADSQSILDLTVPPRATIALDYVNFLSGAGDIDAAEYAWARLLQMNLPFDFHQASQYLDALIQHRQLAEAADAWSALADRFPGRIRAHTSDANLLSNGGFESEILNMGFDWRVVPVEGAVVSVDSLRSVEGARSIRIEFDGTRNLDYWQLFQFVPVKPGTRYKFSGYMRLEGITTDSGPRFELYDGYEMGNLFVTTKNMIRTSDWSVQQLEFETKPNTRLLIVRMARPASRKFDNQIAGTVWIDHVSLEPEN
jgi:tetratricopeptide (TPR) repeat protein